MKYKSRPKYFSQISSMPYLGDLFKLEELPIHRKQMAILLRDIEPEDQDYMHSIEIFFVPREDNFNIRNEAYITQLENLLAKAPSITLYNLILEMHAIDIVVKSLAARHAEFSNNLVATSNNSDVQNISNQISLNHKRPYYAMEFQRPWVKSAHALLHENNVFGLQRLILDVKWKLLASFASYNYFNFEALVIYVLKWQFARVYLISNSKPNIREVVLATLRESTDDSE